MTLCIQSDVRAESLSCGFLSFDSFRVAYFFNFILQCCGSMKTNKVTRGMRNHSRVFLMLTRTINVKQLKSVENADSTRSRPHFVCRRLHQGQLRETVPTSTRDSKCLQIKFYQHPFTWNLEVSVNLRGLSATFTPGTMIRSAVSPEWSLFKIKGRRTLLKPRPKAMPVEMVKRLQDLVVWFTIHLTDHFI